MLLAAAIWSVRRRRRRPAPRPPANTPPLWRLLIDALVEGARRR